MNSLFEYTDTLNLPFEVFLFDAGKETFPIRAHWHYFVEILYIIQGNALVTCNDESFVVGPDELVVFPPSSVHAIYAAGYGPLRYYVLKFDTNQLNSSVHSSETGNIRFSALFPPSMVCTEESCKLSLQSQKEEKNREKIRSLFEDCIREMNAKEFGYMSVTRSLLCELMILLVRRVKALGYELPTIQDSSSREANINTITEYIDSHLDEELKVEDLASRCNMSYSYFAKCFHDLYGQTCKQYISFLRLCKAENMLMFTDYDLTYISQETGFCDCSHLIHAFKQKNGITPHQYRRAHSSED